MSGVLPRSVSLMDSNTALRDGTGDLGKEVAPANFPQKYKTVEQNGSSSVAPNPLKIFSAAKKKIREIFQDLDGEMRESTAFLRSKY